MYIRKRMVRKKGRTYEYWELVESERTERGPRQRSVAYLGVAEPGVRIGMKLAATGEHWPHQRSLLEDEEPELLREAMPGGLEDVPWWSMSLVLALGRLLDPSSELRLAEHLYERTAMSDILGIPASKINDDRLYRALDKLLEHKGALESHLGSRLGDLFGIEYDLILYDVTSAYFEGLAEDNEQARRGHSRDHRPDCKQVCIGLAKIEETCRKKQYQVALIAERVGRLRERNSRASGLFAVDVHADESGAARVVWSKVEAWREWARSRGFRWGT